MKESNGTRRFVGLLGALTLVGGLVVGLAGPAVAAPAAPAGHEAVSVVTPDVAAPAGVKWRDGWCKKGEGQTVVVDASAYTKPRPDIFPANGVIIRCNIGALNPPGDGDGRTKQLRGVDITYRVADSGLVDDIAKIPSDNAAQKWWMFSAAEVGGKWDPDGWSKVPVVDGFYGVTWGGNALPTVTPQFAS